MKLKAYIHPQYLEDIKEKLSKEEKEIIRSGAKIDGDKPRNFWIKKRCIVCFDKPFDKNDVEIIIDILFIPDGKD